LRIAVVSPFLDRRHGTERALCEALERLSRNYPCEIHLFAQRVEDLAVRLPEKLEPSDARIVWHRVPAIPGPHILQFVFWFFCNRAIRRALSRGARVEFDLVLSPGINCSDADVVIVHALFHRLRDLSAESGAPAQMFQKLHQVIYYRLMCWLERIIYQDPAVHLAAVSPRTKGDLSRYLAREDVAVIANAVDTKEFSPSARRARRAEIRQRFALAQGEFVLLLIGNDWRVKGLPAVLEAMKLLGDLPLRLLVVGHDTLAPFQKLAQRLGVLPRCVWLPPEEDVLTFYAAADAYVSPTLEDSFAFPVAEAMACGLPAITSVNAGISAYLTSGANSIVLANPRDEKVLAEHIRKLYDAPDVRERLEEAAARAAGAWTWERNAAQVWELLQSALRKN
jgi:UDP-glucose:(heptosyl)LPS alpha-1,3-glucosyltransferase